MVVRDQKMCFRAAGYARSCDPANGPRRCAIRTVPSRNTQSRKVGRVERIDSGNPARIVSCREHRIEQALSTKMAPEQPFTEMVHGCLSRMRGQCELPWILWGWSLISRATINEASSPYIIQHAFQQILAALPSLSDSKGKRLNIQQAVNAVIIYQSGAPRGFGNAIFNGGIKSIALPSGQRNVDRWFNTGAGCNRNDGSVQRPQQDDLQRSEHHHAAQHRVRPHHWRRRPGRARSSLR